MSNGYLEAPNRQLALKCHSYEAQISISHLDQLINQLISMALFRSLPFHRLITTSAVCATERHQCDRFGCSGLTLPDGGTDDGDGKLWEEEAGFLVGGRPNRIGFLGSSFKRKSFAR